MNKLPSIHPGEVLLKDFLEPMALSQNALARATEPNTRMRRAPYWRQATWMASFRAQCVKQHGRGLVVGWCVGNRRASAATVPAKTGSDSEVSSRIPSINQDVVP